MSERESFIGAVARGQTLWVLIASIIYLLVGLFIVSTGGDLSDHENFFRVLSRLGIVLLCLVMGALIWILKKVPALRQS